MTIVYVYMHSNYIYIHFNVILVFHSNTLLVIPALDANAKTTGAYLGLNVGIHAIAWLYNGEGFWEKIKRPRHRFPALFYRYTSPCSPQGTSQST